MGAPFECNLCSFRNVCRRNPLWRNCKDDITLACTRRANMDAFWARESSTMKGNLARHQ